MKKTSYKRIIFSIVHILCCCLLNAVFLFFMIHPFWPQIKQETKDTFAENSIENNAAGFTEALRQVKANKLTAANETLAQTAALGKITLSSSSVISKGTLEPPTQTAPYATISIGRLGMSVPVYYGDTKALLRKGAGMYTGVGSATFGEGKQIIVAGHNTNDFRPLKDAVVGDTVNVTTSYGEFVYSIVRIEVYDMNDSSSYNLNLDHEQLAMYTCYPFTGPPGKTQRYFCYCDKVSGPVLVN